MSNTSRRSFLAIAGVGAAGVAVAGVAGSASGSTAAAPAPITPAKTQTTPLPDDASGSLVAYVSDVRDGRVSVMVGEREVVIRDRELVARLAQAVKS